MNLTDVIENYIRGEVLRSENEILEIKRADLASLFSCVPSQINYVISTRFAPEMGFYVESKRGGGGCIRIQRISLEDNSDIVDIFDKIGNKMSQHAVDVYLKSLLDYNILDNNSAKMIRIAVSDKSLANVDILKKDMVRADIFKNLIINSI